MERFVQGPCGHITARGPLKTMQALAARHGWVVVMSATPAQVDGLRRGVRCDRCTPTNQVNGSAT